MGPPLDGKVSGGYLNTVVKSKLRSMAKKSVKSEAGLGFGVGLRDRKNGVGGRFL